MRPNQDEVSSLLADFNRKEGEWKPAPQPNGSAIIRALPATEPQARIRLIPFDEIKLGTEPRYLVKGIIPRIGLTVAWGPPKCGKSFWIFDLSLHVALGWEYRGRRVQQGPVVYCAFEGQTGIQARVEAFRQTYPIEMDGPVPFYLQPLTLDLIVEYRDLIAAIRRQLALTAPVMVVLDTLNRSLRGSENDSEDMAAYVAAADAIRAEFNCAVVIVHHCGIDGTRPRGSTALTGAVDAQLSVKRDASDAILVEIEFMKDGPADDIIASRLEVVEVGKDTDGETISSCVVKATEVHEPPKAGTTRRLPDRAKLGLRALNEAIIAHGKPAPSELGLPFGVKAVSLPEWREELYRQNIISSEASNPRADFTRIQNQLAARDLIGSRNNLVWAV
jgi:hypothetical protein